jgi:hypothetical protein
VKEEKKPEAAPETPANGESASKKKKKNGKKKPAAGMLLLYTPCFLALMPIFLTIYCIVMARRCQACGDGGASDRRY